MSTGPLSRNFGRYRIEFRKVDHVDGRPTPHVEVWKGKRKIGNYDMASGRPLFRGNALPRVNEFIESYLLDPQVQSKVKQAIEASFFDLSKPAGVYGGVPKGFKVTVTVEIPEA